MLVINPEECIDCGVCEPECPIEAIKPESEDLVSYIELNKKFSEMWPNITRKKAALPDAEEWRNVKDKLQHLSPNPPVEK